MELCAGGSVVWLGIKGSFSFLYGVRLCGNQFRDADQVVGDEVQQESSGDTSNPAMLSLAHRAMLLAPAKDGASATCHSSRALSCGHLHTVCLIFALMRCLLVMIEMGSP